MKKTLLTITFVLASFSILEASSNKVSVQNDCFDMAWEAYGIVEGDGGSKEWASEVADYVYDRCEWDNFMNSMGMA